MPLARHIAPVHPGEDILDIPKGDDPRVEVWLKSLQDLGIIDADCKVLIRGAVLRRGICPEGWIWEIEWPDPVPA